MSARTERTFSGSCSKENSGVCTPITTSPWPSYFLAQARTYGSDRSQLMHVYVQKLTTTTLPSRSGGARGGELSQPVAPPKEGRRLSLENGTIGRVNSMGPVAPITSLREYSDVAARGSR